MLAISIWDGQRIWATDISRTREVFFVYCVIAITLLRRPWRILPPTVFVPAAVLLALAVSGLLAWTHQLDWARGVNFWSEIVTLAACLMFGLAYGAARWTAWRYIVIAAGVVVSALQLGSLLLGVTTQGFSPGAPAFYGARPVAAHIALLILVGFVLVLVDQDIAAKIRLPLASFLGVSVVLTQHRSVWVALLIVLALASVMVLGGSLARLSAVPVVVTGAFFLAALLLPYVGIQILPGSASSSAVPGANGLPEVAQSSDTLHWRWEMWSSRLESPRSVLQWLVGGSAGQTPAFGPSSDVMNPGNSAHSMFIDVQIMLGLVGLAIVLWLFYLAVLKVRRLNDLAVCMWASLGYGVFYIWPSWVWMMLGTAVALSVQSAPAANSAEVRPRPADEADKASLRCEGTPESVDVHE